MTLRKGIVLIWDPRYIPTVRTYGTVGTYGTYLRYGIIEVHIVPYVLKVPNEDNALSECHRIKAA